MIAALRRLFTSRFPYPTELKRQRASILLLITYGLIGIQIAALVYSVFIRGQADPIVLVANAFGFVVLVAQIQLINTGRLTLAIWLFITLSFLLLAPFALRTGINLNFIILLVPLIAAGVLLNRRGTLIVLVITAALMTVRFINQIADTTSLRVSPAELLEVGLPITVMTLGFSAVLLLLFSGSTERITQSSSEDIRHLLNISAFISDVRSYTRLSGRDNAAQKVMQDALQLLEDDLGYTIAQIYLISGGQIARRVRKDSVYESGNFVLTDSEARFVREAIVLDTPGPLLINALDSLEAARFLTPPAVTAALFPLRSEERTIGVLEIQSASVFSFAPNQIAALRALANALAIADYLDENFTALQTTLGDQQQILNRVRTQLSEAQQRSERILVEGWGRFLEGRSAERAVGYDITLDRTDGLHSAQPVPASDLPPAIRDALQRGEIVVEYEGDDQIVKAPISLRGEVLGAMSFRIPGNAPLSDRQLEMVRTISNRLATALENNRLFEQSQNQAQREHKANEIAGELLTATNVETLMSLAAERFNEALGAVYTRVTLQPGALADSPLPAIANGGGHHDNGSAGSPPAYSAG